MNNVLCESRIIKLPYYWESLLPFERKSSVKKLLLLLKRLYKKSSLLWCSFDLSDISIEDGFEILEDSIKTKENFRDIVKSRGFLSFKDTKGHSLTFAFDKRVHEDKDEEKRSYYYVCTKCKQACDIENSWVDINNLPPLPCPFCGSNEGKYYYICPKCEHECEIQEKSPSFCCREQTNYFVCPKCKQEIKS